MTITTISARQERHKSLELRAYKTKAGALRDIQYRYDMTKMSLAYNETISELKYDETLGHIAWTVYDESKPVADAEHVHLWLNTLIVLG